jgi:hypothetical protein
MSQALQLTTTDASAPSKALAARQAPTLPLAQLNPLEVGKAFARLLSRTALLLGHKTWQDEAELFVLASSCAETMQRRFPGFKWEEVDEAMKRGASGEYKQDPKDVLYLSLPTVASWLEAYQRTARAFAVAAVTATNQLPAAPPPTVDYIGSVVGMVEQARETCLPVGYELDLGNQVYDWLKSVGAFTGWRPADYYAEMRAQETDKLLAEHKATKGAERIEYNTFLAALNLGKLPDAHPLSRSVVNACKKRVLREWLMQHAADETDVHALLTDLTNQHKQAA